jgi:hypothetical protein
MPKTFSGGDGDAATLELRLLDVERAIVSQAYLGNRLTDEARRRIERELDLEDARLRHVLFGSGVQRRDDDTE